MPKRRCSQSIRQLLPLRNSKKSSGYVRFIDPILLVVPFYIFSKFLILPLLLEKGVLMAVPRRGGGDVECLTQSSNYAVAQVFYSPAASEFLWDPRYIH
ncbi:hypothetical protein F5Y14DRAFT_456226 [Nemania sp. NC0429]|nr:hypothetical protein F5Y14DRAFT_456226 [Nemania sp. NC0429]